MKYEKLTFDATRPMSHVITVPAESDYGIALRLTRNGEEQTILTASAGDCVPMTNVGNWFLMQNTERKKAGRESVDVEIVEKYDTIDMTLDSSFTLSNQQPLPINAGKWDELGDVLPQGETILSSWVGEPIVMGVMYDSNGNVEKAGDFISIDPSNRIGLSGQVQGLIGECKQSYGGWRFLREGFRTDDVFALIWHVQVPGGGKTSVEGVIPLRSKDGSTSRFRLDVNRDGGVTHLEIED